MKIMIVEDEAIIAIELERIVKDAGHEVIGPFSTMEQALAHGPQVDAALVDLGLADGHSGSALGRRLMDRFGIKVVFVTGSPGGVGYGIEGAVDVVAKPFTDERILTSLRKLDVRQAST